jgi:hypothetical protein
MNGRRYASIDGKGIPGGVALRERRRSTNSRATFAQENSVMTFAGLRFLRRQEIMIFLSVPYSIF